MIGLVLSARACRTALQLACRNKVYNMARKPYESDTTRFIRDFLQQHPEVVEKQRNARSTWWDRPQDREQRKKFEDARLPKRPYEYY